VIPTDLKARSPTEGSTQLLSFAKFANSFSFYKPGFPDPVLTRRPAANVPGGPFCLGLGQPLGLQRLQICATIATGLGAKRSSPRLPRWSRCPRAGTALNPIGRRSRPHAYRSNGGDPWRHPARLSELGAVRGSNAATKRLNQQPETAPVSAGALRFASVRYAM
jgi:hypothetical protein